MSATDAFLRFSTRFDDFAAECRARRVYNDPFTITGSSLGARVYVREKPGRHLSFVSLNYLGIGEEPEIIECCAENVRRYGMGFASSRTVADASVYEDFERLYMEHKRAKGCVLAPTGYEANHMAVAALLGQITALGKRLSWKRKMVALVDKLSHNSLHKALSVVEARHNGVTKIEIKRYPHLDYDRLEEILMEVRREGGDDVFPVMVGDSVYSMDGDVTDVRKLLELAKRYQAFILLDNAHSDGVYGPQGRGCVEAAGITDPEDLKYFFQTATLSKAYAGIGGIFTLPFESLAELIRVSHDPYVFSVALPLFLVATYLKTLEIVRGEIGDERRWRLATTSEMARDLFRKADFNILSTQTHVIPVIVKSGPKCLQVQEYLMEEHGVLIGAIRPPAVEDENSLLRVSLTALHTEDDVGQLFEALRKARDKFGF